MRQLIVFASEDRRRLPPRREIYLFHHLTLVSLAVWLSAWEGSAFLKYPIVVVVTFVFTLALPHFVVGRVPWLGFLFNGTRGEPPRRRV